MLRRPVSLSEAVTGARVAHRESVEAFVAWSARMGRTVDPDVPALIHAVEEHQRERSDHGWDRAAFYGFYRCDLWNWCTLADCDYPDVELPEVLWLWLYHRDLSGRWGPDDEPLHELLKVLLCYGNIGFDGRPLPDGRTRRLVPCECFVSRRHPLPPGEAPTIDDLVQEMEAELGPVRRHG